MMMIMMMYCIGSEHERERGGRERERENRMIQPIPGNMSLRITIPDYDFQITNIDSVNFCTSRKHFHTDF